LKHEIHRNSSTLTLSRWCCPAYRLPSWLRMRPSYRFDIDSRSYTGWYPSKRKYTQPNEISWDIMRYHDVSWTCPAYNPISSHFFIFFLFPTRVTTVVFEATVFHEMNRTLVSCSLKARRTSPRWCYWRIRWVSNGSSMGHQWVNNGWTMG
jgi:hypothetical protein